MTDILASSLKNNVISGLTAVYNMGYAVTRIPLFPTSDFLISAGGFIFMPTTKASYSGASNYQPHTTNNFFYMPISIDNSGTRNKDENEKEKDDSSAKVVAVLAAVYAGVSFFTSMFQDDYNDHNLAGSSFLIGTAACGVGAAFSAPALVTIGLGTMAVSYGAEVVINTYEWYQ